MTDATPAALPGSGWSAAAEHSHQGAVLKHAAEGLDNPQWPACRGAFLLSAGISAHVCCAVMVRGFAAFWMFVLLSGLQAPEPLFEYFIIQQPNVNTGMKAAYFDVVTLPAKHRRLTEGLKLSDHQQLIPAACLRPLKARLLQTFVHSSKLRVWLLMSPQNHLNQMLINCMLISTTLF